MRTFLISSSRVLLAVVLLSSLRVSGQVPPDPQEDVLTRSARTDDESLPAFSAFQSVLLVSGVPGGVAFMEGCPDQQVPIVHPRGTTLREVLNSITAGDSAYAWRMREGVVNLEPSTGLPALLTTHLNTYYSQNVTDAVSAVTFLSSSPEVTRAATKLGLAQNVLGPGLGSMAQGPPSPKQPLGIRLHDVTLVDALDAIARANKHGVWTYRETHCGSIHQFNLSFAQ
jgi:hypothetical protein